MVAGQARLGLVPVAVIARVLVGVPFAYGWLVGVVLPLVNAMQSDVPEAILFAATFVAGAAPLLLYLRRHALGATLRWDEQTITLLRNGRTEMAIAWRDARVRFAFDVGFPERTRVVQIADDAGRCITVVSGSGFGGTVPSGRRHMRAVDLDALLDAAEQRSELVSEPPQLERGTALPLLWLVLGATHVLSTDGPPRAITALYATSATVLCAVLLLDPLRRLHAALARPSGRETLVIDTEERGRLRARRLDGSRVLLDVDAASHPDAMLHARRGFVSAVLAIPTDAAGATYRSLEEPIPATFVETRDDRILRFEHLRAALVDVIGYGAFFATAIAAATIT